MILTKISPQDKEDLKRGNISLLRKLLEMEENALKDRIIDDKDNTDFFRGAASFCRALNRIVKN